MRDKSVYNRFVKRFLDIVFSLLAIIVLSPILLLIYILSLIFLRGNPVFKQWRPGKNGKVFLLYKFRSMTNKKDKDGNLLPDKERITPWGKFLRKTSIDELLQFFNVLKGDMSIVGPRPRLVKDMIFYDEDVIKEAYCIKPGITSLCQIKGGRSEASWETVFETDKQYVKSISFWRDFKIIFQTFGTIFKGVYGAEDSVRDYYYSDYLLRTKKITKKQYNLGLAKANEIIQSKGTVIYQKELHNDTKEETSDDKK